MLDKRDRHRSGSSRVNSIRTVPRLGNSNTNLVRKMVLAGLLLDSGSPAEIIKSHRKIVVLETYDHLVRWRPLLRKPHLHNSS